MVMRVSEDSGVELFTELAYLVQVGRRGIVHQLVADMWRRVGRCGNASSQRRRAEPYQTALQGGLLVETYFGHYGHSETKIQLVS